MQICLKWGFKKIKTTSVIIALFMLSIFINGTNITFSDDITIVCINEDTVKKIGPYPFSRDKYADFIESIYSNYNPKCVYFNLIISQYQKGSMDSDIQLFNAINEKQNLFFSAMVSDIEVKHPIYNKSQFNEHEYNKMWNVEGAVFPLEEIAKSGAYISISDVGLNKHGIVEGMPTVVQINSSKYLSTPLFLTIAYLDLVPADIVSLNGLRLGNKKVKTDRYGWFEIDFNHKFKKYSYHDILNKKVQRDSIDQRIILFGIDFTELEDYLRISKNTKIPGVEVIANATQTLIDQLRE